MDNLEDYYLIVQNYKIGNYKYETITSPDDVKDAVENGKTFVFLGTGAKFSFILGLTLLFIGIILSIILYYLMDVFLTVDILFFSFILLCFGIFLIPSLILIIHGFLTLRTHFIVLCAEGIVYKLKIGSIKGFNWENVSMDFFVKSSKREIKSIISVQIGISMPNGDFLEFGRGDYTMKEFGGNQADALFLLTFKNYYNYGKGGTFDPPRF